MAFIREKHKVSRNEKWKKQLWVFVYIKYGKFWSISLGHFIKHKLLFLKSESSPTPKKIYSTPCDTQIRVEPSLSHCRSSKNEWHISPTDSQSLQLLFSVFKTPCQKINNEFGKCFFLCYSCSKNPCWKPVIIQI